MEDSNTSDVPMPCTGGCGFYGSKIYNNMCSKCFREQSAAQQKKEKSPPMLLQQEQQQQQPPMMPTIVANPNPYNKSLEQTDQNERAMPAKPVQKTPGRCFMCRAKIPIAKQLSNKCRCDYVFCDSHRYPDKHECSFDHVSMDKDILAKKNPKLNERPRGGRSFQRLDSL